MDREENLCKLAYIIKDYRKGELDFSVNAHHVEKWIAQFSPESQDVILDETVHIFEEWYFNNATVDKNIDKIIPYLQKKYNFNSSDDVFCSVSFLLNQKSGLSQYTIHSRFADRVVKRYGTSIYDKIQDGIKYYVYFDDGLYTGSRARKDLLECICCLPENSTLEVFYIVACESAYRYVKQKIEVKAKERNIIIRMHCFKVIEDCKTYFYNSDDSGMSWNIHINCLWPDNRSKSDGEVAEYCNYLLSLNKNTDKFLFRKYPWNTDAGLFTSVENRNIVEKEFLICGIRILNKVTNRKGIYPLGYNLWPSFGLGSFCAFDMNISNTCPLVLWWGNNKNKGDILDNWYPLLPRRVNQNEDQKNLWGNDPYYGASSLTDQYNMCPDCGRLFGIDEDGGNGFCVDCAWKH